MRILANAFHPDFAQSRVVRTWADKLDSAGIEVRRHSAEPLDIAAEQAACDRADVLLFVFPMHWYSGPWMLKRWIDQVLTYGWAYGEPNRLAGKAWMNAISVGAGEPEYGPEGSRCYTIEEFLRPFERTAGFCEMRYLEPFLNFGGGYIGEEEIANSATRLTQQLDQLK